MRVIADIHAEPEALREALDGSADRHVVLLGDLVDFGPDPSAVLELALDLVESHRATLIRSNHDDRLYRHYLKGRVLVRGTLVQTLAAIASHPGADHLVDRFCAAYERAPLWLRLGDHVLAHGAVDPLMAEHPAPACELSKKLRGELMALALYGERQPGLGPGELPIRTHGWVDRLPAGLTAIVGHDIRSREAPLVAEGRAGGRAIFLDTGSGKGGRLSWIDLPQERITLGERERQA